jgi:hypothetical protein
MNSDSDRLDGWKAIAEHLNKSLRTVQLWADEKGLPIHKIGGRIVAFKPEITEWLDQQAALPLSDVELKTEESDSALCVPEQPHIGGPESASDVHPTKVLQVKPGWVRVWFLAAAAPLLLGAIAFAVVRLTHEDKGPTAWRIAGRALTVLGADGHEQWHHIFATELADGTYTGPAWSTQSPCVFTDLDRRGAVGTLFYYRPMNINIDPPEILYFNGSGKVKWAYAASRTITDSGSREWTPPYFARFAVITPKAGPRRVVVSSLHYWSYPNQVVVLDANGKVQGEFWHRGHLDHIAVTDLDDDGEPEIILGGVNDAPEYK